MRSDEVVNEVLPLLVPSVDERERTFGFVNAFLGAVNESLKKAKVRAVAVLGGSYAKDTWLSGDHDVDVFVRFDPGYPDGEISDVLERVLSKWKPVRIHGSRDYFWVKDHVRFELVPVRDLKKSRDAKNVTDFSPLHVEWVNKKGKRLKDDIRLVKKFCKVAKCYGAESYIRGFSGHVVDILTIYYEGFVPLLRAVRKWKSKVVVDYYDVYKGKVQVLMNGSKIEGPLVVVDPVQPGRNAAAALNEENFDRFVCAAKAFLKKPSVDFFVEKKVSRSELEAQGAQIVDVKTECGREDVVGAKFVRAFEYVRDFLADFCVVDSGWEWDKNEVGLWWFVVKNNELPKVLDWEGPPVGLKEAVVSFKKKYKVTFVRDGRVFARRKRKVWQVRQALKAVLNSEFVKSRVKEVRV